MNPNKALWEKGDFTRIAQTHEGERRGPGRAASAITKGLKVLDLGCGDGTTAMPEAKLGADVLGVDIARNLVEAGNRRAAGGGPHEPRFQEGDASQPAGPEGSARSTSSSASSAPCSRRSRSTWPRRWCASRKPGGRIVMGNWIPERPDARRADPEDQLRLLAAAAGGLHQPDDLGRREQRDRALRRRGHPEGEDLLRAGHVHLQLRRRRRASSWRRSATTTGRP